MNLGPAIRSASLALGLTAALVLATGCSAAEPSNSKGEETPSSETTTTVALPQYTVEEQVAIITGRDVVELSLIEGSEAWLGSADLAAYVDPVTHDEFIVDISRAQVLRYDIGTDVFQSPIDAPMYPGEPSRDEALMLAEEWAVEYTPEFDISSMRCTALRRTSGEGNDGPTLEYQVMYQTYVGGVRMPEWVSVNVGLPTWTWTPSRSAFPHSESYEAVPPPSTTAIQALEMAVEATGYTDYAVEYIDLYWWKGSYEWNVKLENLNVDPMTFGNHAAGVHVDAMTGELLGMDTCG